MKKDGSNTNVLKDILQKWKASFDHEEKLDQEKVRALWGNVAGETANAYTSSIILKNKILYITVSSATLRHDLMFRIDLLLSELNNNFEQPVIEKIIIK